MAAGTWTEAELAEIDACDEMQIASIRSNGELSSGRTIWAVREGERVYVRSVNGPGAAWFRSTRAVHAGLVSAGTLSREVIFVDVEAADPVEERLDTAYRAKYRRYAKSIVDRITSPEACAATIELVPHDPEN